MTYILFVCWVVMLLFSNYALSVLLVGYGIAGWVAAIISGVVFVLQVYLPVAGGLVLLEYTRALEDQLKGEK